MAFYHEGDELRLTCTFTNTAGAKIDPAAINFWYKDPTGATTTLVSGVDADLVKSATGIYYVDLDLNREGQWHWEWFSTGAGQAKKSGYIDVIRSLRA